MNLANDLRYVNSGDFLHICGDEPTKPTDAGTLIRIFSIYVEMNLYPSSTHYSPDNFLHICGDEPFSINSFSICHRFSPYMWR